MDADEPEVVRLGRRLDRARKARLEAERISEQITGELYEKQQELRAANARLKQETRVAEEAERAARESKERLQAILDNTRAIVYAKDVDYRYILVNKQFEELFGMSEQELVGKTDEDLLPPEAVEQVRANDRRVLETAEIVEQEEVVPRDGVPRTYLSIKVPLLDAAGTPYAVCAISTDITERKRAESYLHAQHAVTRVLAESAKQDDVMPSVLEALGESMGWEVGAFWSLDEDAGVLRCRELWHAPTLDLGEFGRLTLAVAFGRGEGLPGQAWESGQPIRIEAGLRESNLTRAPAAAALELDAAVALPIKSGAKTLGVIEFFSRETKTLGLDLMAMISSLSTQVGQFIERRQAERDADRLKDEFFSLVSHEFRTPLTSIIGFLELLLEEGEVELTDAERREFLAVIKRNSERLMRLVGDLLFVSGVEAGKFSLVEREVELADLARQSVEAATPAATARGIDLKLEIDGAPAVLGDSDRLAQLLDNLVSNAVKYTPEGEHVELRISAQPRQVVAEITNTGAYIPPEEVEHLFERFFRASTATTREVPGVGLGLAIARTIVHAHGGQLTVQSSREAGTTFRAALPPAAVRAAGSAVQGEVGT